jgi:hypothetical protein
MSGQLNSFEEMFRGNPFIQFCAFGLFVAGVFEFVVGIMIHRTVPNPYGAWWAGAGCMIAGVSGLMQGSPQLHSIAYCVGILACIVAVAGAIMDSIGYDVVKVLDTCVSDDGVYGQTDASAVNQAMTCRAEHLNWDCTCINVHQNGYCYSYDLVHDKTNCLQILGTYTNLMHESVRCLGFLVAFTIFYCIYQCVLTMCPGSCAPFCFKGACVNSSTLREPLANQQHFGGNGYPPNSMPAQVAYVVPAEGVPPAPYSNEVSYASHTSSNHSHPPMASVVLTEPVATPSAPPAPPGKDIV